jgi:hypothetical protein
VTKLRDGRPEDLGVRCQAEAKDFLIVRIVQIGYEAHAASYTMGNRDYFPTDKTVGA